MVSSDKDIMSEIASDDVIERAYEWLCERRKDYSANNDVWHLRWRWQENKPLLQADLLSGKYRERGLDRTLVGAGCTGSQGNRHCPQPTPEAASIS